MNKKDAKEIIKKIAKKEGKPESEVRKEMKKAIVAGFMNPKTKTQWTNLFGEGILPTPEEFIAIISNSVMKV